MYLRQQQISNIQAEIQHEAKTVHAEKVFVNNQIQGTVTAQKNAVKMVKFYWDIGTKDAEENAISEVIEYDNQRRSLKANLQLQTPSPAKIMSTMKRQKLLDQLLANVDDQSTHPWNVNNQDTEELL